MSAPTKKAKGAPPAAKFEEADKPVSTAPSALSQVGEHSLILSSGAARVEELRLYYKNPRQGDVDGIAESLRATKQYKAIVVNRGSKTGRHNEVLAGNHTLLGARKLGWQTIHTDWVDVDESTAATIVAVDNKMADRGGYDETILAGLLRDLPEDAVTGYTPEEIDEIVKAVPVEDIDALMAETENIVADYAAGSDAAEAAGTFEGSPLGEEPDDFDDGPGPKLRDDVEAGEDAVDDGGAGDEIGESEEELPGARTLKSPADMDFGAGVTWHEFPKLRGDKFLSIDDLPKDGLYAWCGPITKTWAPDPDNNWWFYQWGVDGTSAMPDVSKVVVGFYCFDDRFENWWWYPERYMAKVLNSGIKYMVMPDFSPGATRIETIWAWYRSLYLARYFQECGIKVAPNLSWHDGDVEFLDRVTIPSLPKNLPLLSMQVQTWKDDTEEEKAAVALTNQHTQYALDKLQPQALLVYHGRKGKDIFKDGTLKFSGPIYYVRSRTDMIAEWQEKTGQRKPKTTI